MLTPKSTIPMKQPITPAGTYKFSVASLKWDKRKCGDRLGECYCADLTLLLMGPDGEHLQHQESLILHENMVWKIAKFFVCIGLRKHGDESPLTPDWWEKVINRTGDCVIDVRKGTNKDFAQVKEWVAPEDPSTTADGPE